MNVPFVDLNTQYQSIKSEIDPAITAVINRSAFILGKEVEDFEREFAIFCETSHAVGVDSGYSALELILHALDIGPGDEVITTANTFIATALAIWSSGARPVFVDIDPITYNIDPAQIEPAITANTRAILPVHLYGHPADMDPILSIARDHNLHVVEDACQAHGSRYKGKRIGSLGDAAAFSFYPSKNLGAYGDGGIVVTKNPAIAEQIRILRDVGQRGKNIHPIKGLNRRLDNLQAAVLLTKLPHLTEWNDGRRRSAALYDRYLSDLPVTVPYVAPWAEPVYHLYVIKVAARDALQTHLSEAGVPTGIHYPTPIHLQPAFLELGYTPGRFPITEAFTDEILSLPIYPELDEDSIAYIASKIQEFVGEKIGFSS